MPQIVPEDSKRIPSGRDRAAGNHNNMILLVAFEWSRGCAQGLGVAGAHKLPALSARPDLRRRSRGAQLMACAR